MLSKLSSDGKTILIVDDASFMRVVLKDILISNGLASKVYEAIDGVSGVESFLKYKPDLTTLDVNMPRANGIQTLKGIMKIDPNAKVVMVTSVEQKHIVQEAMKNGARDYVVKPFDRNRVGMVVSKILRAR